MVLEGCLDIRTSSYCYSWGICTECGFPYTLWILWVLVISFWIDECTDSIWEAYEWCLSRTLGQVRDCTHQRPLWFVFVIEGACWALLDCVLMHKDQFIAYASHQLRPHETHYPIHDSEWLQWYLRYSFGNHNCTGRKFRFSRIIRIWNSSSFIKNLYLDSAVGLSL